MTLDTMAAFRFDLRKFTRDEVKQALKKLSFPTVIRRVQVTQTLGEKVWFFYEFKNKFDRDEFLEVIPEELRAQTMNGEAWLTETALQNWTKKYSK